MEVDIFLFVLALVWTGFAAVHDLKTREVPNWVSFSLIAFALAYKAFSAVFFHDARIFIFGILGFALFYVLALGFYYSKVFAGGDAKLLMGFGVLMPALDLWSLFLYGFGFLLLLFLIGAVWSVGCSLFLAIQKKNLFIQSFKKQWLKILPFFAISIVVSIMILLALPFSVLSWYLAGLFVFIPLLFIYVRAVEQGCMIKKVSPSRLTEGDWLEREVKIGNRVIRKSVHGLSTGDIRLLKKNRKKVWIKEGIPFVPAFFFALLFMGFFWASGLEILLERLISLYG